MAYTPLGALDYIGPNTLDSQATLLTYDRGRLAGELRLGGTMLRRYVHGPGMPAPAEVGELLVWYEGSRQGAGR